MAEPVGWQPAVPQSARRVPVWVRLLAVAYTAGSVGGPVWWLAGQGGPLAGPAVVGGVLVLAAIAQPWRRRRGRG